MLWKCEQCPDVTLCSSCYHSDKHDIIHKFTRFDYSGHQGSVYNLIIVINLINFILYNIIIHFANLKLRIEVYNKEIFNECTHKD